MSQYEEEVTTYKEMRERRDALRKQLRGLMPAQGVIFRPTLKRIEAELRMLRRMASRRKIDTSQHILERLQYVESLARPGPWTRDCRPLKQQRAEATKV